MSDMLTSEKERHKGSTFFDGIMGKLRKIEDKRKRKLAQDLAVFYVVGEQQMFKEKQFPVQVP